HREYAMTVPFCERLFQLAGPGGWVGQITANSFMKREFGKKLIEEFLVRQDLVEVIDVSGVPIPGHGIPPVILVGRSASPAGNTVRGVLAVRSNPGTPTDPANSVEWRSIVDNVDEPGVETPYVSVVDLPRELLRTYPWALTGGGNIELKQSIQGAEWK